MNTTVCLINSAGWETSTMQQLLTFDPKPVAVDGRELLPNGRFRIMAVTLKSLEDARLFYATAKEALKFIQG